MKLQTMISFLYCLSILLTGCGNSSSESSQAKPLLDSMDQAPTPADVTNPQDLGPAPDFTLPTVQKGGSLSFSQYQGKVVLIDFWATWCPPCRNEIPGFINLYQKYQKKGLEIIGISLDEGSPTAVKQFTEKFLVNYPVVIGDYEVTRAYGGIRALPTAFLVNAKGRIVKKYIGAKSVEDFERDILDLLNTHLISP